MLNVLEQNGEVKLLSEDFQKIITIDSLEEWQVDQMMHDFIERLNVSYSSHCLSKIDTLYLDWMKSLSAEHIQRIRRQRSLFGIPISKEWVMVWRMILKEPGLRDLESATRNGQYIGSFAHIWTLWAVDMIERTLSPLEKELLEMVDAGYPFFEIGETLLAKYGDEFWKKRKADSKTTSPQVVSNYMYQKLPTKLARQELTELALSTLL